MRFLDTNLILVQLRKFSCRPQALRSGLPHVALCVCSLSVAAGRGTIHRAALSFGSRFVLAAETRRVAASL